MKLVCIYLLGEFDGVLNVGVIVDTENVTVFLTFAFAMPFWLSPMDISAPLMVRVSFGASTYKVFLLDDENFLDEFSLL